ADLHGVYHRLDVLFGSPEANVPEKEEVCRLEGHFVSFQQSVIKLVPTVFQDPELYKYSQETVTNSIKLNQFVSKGIMTDLLDTVTPVASKQFMPDSPGPMHGLERCPIPCAAILNAGDRMSPGSIVALVVGLIVFVGILVIIGVKLYTKMFIRSQGLNRGTFSDVFYNRRNERVDMNNKTSTPYSELEN
ncbi:hypothetical protein MAR_012463, partial [Mya arenaria]